MMEDIIVIRGGGDIATGVVHRLHRSGFKILILEIEKPTVIRRTVSFAQAVFDGSTVVEGVKAVKVNNKEEIYKCWEDKNLPVIIDENLNILNEIKADVLVDGILAKENLGTSKNLAPITVALGPGFEAGVDVDVVIETKRGHYLGSLIFDGFAEPNSGIPGIINGFGKERVIKSPADGIIRHVSKIGDIVKKDDIIAYVDEVPVKASIDGVLRGLIMEELEVHEGLKIADVDPRGIQEYCNSISEKARAVGGGVLEAILYLKMKRETC
ncbi:selenium-dependent molybdenum cofactor biosynthesis protein YqeB [Proteiniborus sp. MB09-C3]|uniref:selenium-dependent molybdenum cofactor biosynthesis protein YqeB n=1 Tax=Proteiniborus sp. MB09-C3 TaxID=3050072 RepID=UPI0025525DBB|nr:selenium-dependent molybdenum cofactor biosynthesis protein YqeB [Proteiniborus sp. MB09-C3]WIV12546.1 selenium-dependent molybdenum cofactor biosynthesis protein YqeB [Proteiniborus sp. MB09-C3]